MDDWKERDPHHDGDLRPSPFDETTDLSAIPSFLRAQVAAAISESDGAARHERPTSNREWVVRVAPRPVIGALDPGAIPMATISPRKLLHVVAAVALAWGVISFGRQVAMASAASTQADELRAANAAITDEVGAMQRELKLIQERRYVDQQARAYRLGSSAEIPFALQADAPALDADAPGSASVRLGAVSSASRPFERWLDVLFGPGN